MPLFAVSADGCCVVTNGNAVSKDGGADCIADAATPVVILPPAEVGIDDGRTGVISPALCSRSAATIFISAGGCVGGAGGTGGGVGDRDTLTGVGVVDSAGCCAELGDGVVGA